jgi:hypothetical protein
MKLCLSVTKHTCGLWWSCKHHQYSNGNQLDDPHDNKAMKPDFQLISLVLYCNCCLTCLNLWVVLSSWADQAFILNVQCGTSAAKLWSVREACCNIHCEQKRLFYALDGSIPFPYATTRTWCFIETLPVYEKTSPNNKITLYLERCHISIVIITTEYKL